MGKIVVMKRIKRIAFLKKIIKIIPMKENKYGEIQSIIEGISFDTDPMTKTMFADKIKI